MSGLQQSAMTQFRWARAVKNQLAEGFDTEQIRDRLAGLVVAAEESGEQRFRRTYEVADLPSFAPKEVLRVDERGGTATTPGGFVLRAFNGTLRLEGPSGARGSLGARRLERILLDGRDTPPPIEAEASADRERQRYSFIDTILLGDGARVLLYGGQGASGDELRQVDVEHGAERVGVRMDIPYGIWKTARRTVRKRAGEWRTAASRGNQRAAALRAEGRVDPRWLTSRPADVTWDVFVCVVRELFAARADDALARQAELIAASAQIFVDEAHPGLPRGSELIGFEDMQLPYCGGVGAAHLYGAGEVSAQAYQEMVERVIATIEVFDSLGGLEDFLADAYIASQRLR